MDEAWASRMEADGEASRDEFVDVDPPSALFRVAAGCEEVAEKTLLRNKIGFRSILVECCFWCSIQSRVRCVCSLPFIYQGERANEPAQCT